MRQRRDGKKEGRRGDFPGGPVVKNSLPNAGDMGWIPGQGTKILHAAEQPSAYTMTSESKPCTRKKDSVSSNQCSQIKKEGRKEPQFWDPLIVYIIQMSYLIDKVSSSNNRK